jgi:chromosome segregation ATPase
MTGESRLDRIEKQIQFLFELDAKAAARQAKNDEQIAKNDRQIAKHDRQIEALIASQKKGDAQIAAIRKLLQAGMKLLAQNQEETRALKASMKAFLDSMRKGGNGNHP